MLFKYFTEKDSNVDLAINSNKVKCVIDAPEGTRIIFDNDTIVTVTESYLNTVTRLSEQ